MARIKISLPEQFVFYTTIPIRITDVNYGGHVGNDTILTLLHEARMQFLNHFNYTELDLEGASLIMSDAAIEFKSELFYGDRVKAYVAANDFSKVGFDVCYKLVNEKDGKVVALAKTGMVCYDYKIKKVVAVPTEAVRKFTTPESLTSKTHEKPL
jgi:acyl-CoA thioester hydrolase